MLKRIFTWVIIISAAVGSLYVFEVTRLPCRSALVYAIGQFDSRFGLSETEFKTAIKEAEVLWEKAIGRNLFQYDEQALFPVNLIFDDRQERTIVGKRLESEFETIQSTQVGIKEKYDAAVVALAQRRKEYVAALKAFDKALGQYNDRVERWNRSNRTDESELDWLRDEGKRLEREQPSLENRRTRVNALVAEVNRSAKEEEKIVERYNKKLDDFTEAYETGEAFDQGIYSGESIDIYQFDDRNHLHMVLVHELGHALGLGHVDNPKSIMYPMMGEQDVTSLVLSVEDRAELIGVCSVTAWDFLLRDVHKVVDLFSK